MNRNPVSTQYQNVSDNERVFRSVFGLAVLAVVSAGFFTVPVVIFTISMISVYMVLTAIIGLDPVYSLSNALSALRGHKTGKLVTH